MKATRRSIKQTTKVGVILVVVVIAIVFLSCFIVSVKVKKNVINAIENLSNNYVVLDYDKISVLVYPFTIKTKLANVKVNLSGNNRKAEIIMKEVLLKSPFFAKNFDLILPSEMDLIMDEGNKNKIILDDHYINFSLNKDFSLNNFNSIAKKITVENIENDDVIPILENISFRIVNLMSEEYRNMTFRLNVDRILIKNLRKNIEVENNLEIIISNMKEFNSEKEVVAVANLVDTFVFNDITNNYAFKINGNYNAEKITKNLSVDLELEIVNYNSLISAINNRGSEYFLNKSRISDIVQMLQIIPENKKNTKSNKYYKVIGNLSSRALFINDENINNLLKKILYNK